MMPRRVLIAVIAGAALLARPAPAEDDTTRALATIKAVAREGKGNDDAGPAWKTVVSKGGAALLPTLEAIDDDNPTAANWLRAAIDAIVDGEKLAGRKLPLTKLEAFALDTKNAALARQVAYELVTSQDPEAKARVLPAFLDDKSPDLRHETIAQQLEVLEALEAMKGTSKEVLKTRLEKLFAYSRDKDQVETIAKKLVELGGKVHVSEQFAFVTQFALVGPFDSTGGKGFAATYPPETATDISATYSGKEDAKVAWKMFATTDKYGTFDVNKLVGKNKEAVVYALATIVAEKDTPCDIRVASPNAIQIFLNGKKIFGREEYHHGSPLDANIGKGILKKGENVIVLKTCQNNQQEVWAQNWQFQLRICDSTGGPLPGILQRLPDNKVIKLGTIPEGMEIKEEKK
jgi:hypothetical protein